MLISVGVLGSAGSGCSWDDDVYVCESFSLGAGMGREGDAACHATPTLFSLGEGSLVADWCVAYAMVGRCEVCQSALIIMNNSR